MLLMRGVDSVESSKSTKAAKNNIDRGVAGRSMLAKNSGVYDCSPARQKSAVETRRYGG